MIGATFGSYLAARFLRTICGVFLTVFLLVYTLDFVEQMRQAGDAEGVGAADLVVILESLKQAGSLQAEMVVL